MPEVKNCETCAHCDVWVMNESGMWAESFCQTYNVKLYTCGAGFNREDWPVKRTIINCPAWQGDMDLAMALVNFCNCCGIVVLNDDGLIVEEHLYCSQECADQMMEENEECDE